MPPKMEFPGDVPRVMDAAVGLVPAGAAKELKANDNDNDRKINSSELRRKSMRCLGDVKQFDFHFRPSPFLHGPWLLFAWAARPVNRNIW